ncbi:DUF885 domain-containing protein [Peristeroidobacter agariperforans]|uniref:DUF885 domain-containing protein n=1 Tax=Peristeroidobacter agariperforans TaxID=268404 RepID=UPI00101CE19F|nr:DUF885 domain-containing protein [Peristeroidobacter agariperforans]
MTEPTRAGTTAAIALALASMLTSQAANGDQAQRTIAEIAAALRASRHSEPGALPDNTAAALRSRHETEDRLHEQLLTLKEAQLQPAAAIAFEALRATVEAEREVRVCRRELWNVDHISGWHIQLGAWAERQPVDSPAARSRALARWQQVQGFIHRETALLRAGLDLGYSAPQAVVRRVVRQLDDQLESAAASSLASPAKRTDDANFARDQQLILQKDVLPELRRYRDFLRDEYVRKARSSIGVSSLPHGRDCYRALLRRETSLGSSPEEIFERGQKMIEENRAAIVELGALQFGTRDVTQIMARLQADPANRFDSPEAVLQFTREVTERAREASKGLFIALPRAPLEVVAFPTYQRDSGMNPYYSPSRDAEPARYLVNLQTWRDNARSQVEVTSVHEAWPGHHVQISLAQSLPYGNELLAVARFPAYIEGWARYAERLADEFGMYTTAHARILWRAKPGFGMVVDPGLHAFDWPRERALEFLMSSGLFPSEQSVNDMIDRIAVMPAQLTAYDTGGSEILSLRELARERLGKKFDLRQFHAQLLGMGYAPLGTVRKLTLQWIERSEQP